ncbi:MAG: agmatine deiminase family protein [Saprospiraceae bacterium]|nr:agmatine deiminase family protein [Saprospiraceae bacterium]MDW8229049.1 agmatine deiminase family protein [Saprospiraceae bacterium]
MKKVLCSFAVLFLFFCPLLWAQQPEEEVLPRYMTLSEQLLLEKYWSVPRFLGENTSPPPRPVRAMAEWEELQAIAITWRGFWPILTEIVRASQKECRVLITCPDSTSLTNARNYLSSRGINLQHNLDFLVTPSNSLWIRDYGPNTAYMGMVDSMCIIDWIYNRPRPLDDSMPAVIAQRLNVPFYNAAQAPDDLVNTGGNFMCDGMGTGFSSKLVLHENAPGNGFGVTPKSEAQIDRIMREYMGLKRYIKMEVLPYDGIHHIDMHMKLLDEETLLVGQYPTGVSDGPQIEANIQYVLSNFKTYLGTPFKVIRIPMPPHDGKYPSQGGHYRTYLNAVFVNKTVIVPFYEEKYDTTARRIWQEALPGYNIVGIDCNHIIPAYGAIHCITKEIGVSDPLLILHQPLSNQVSSCMVNNAATTGYTIWASAHHRSGIDTLKVCYATNPNGPWTCTPLPLHKPDDTLWTHRGLIPRQPAGTTIYYYLEAVAKSGKRMARPMPAPKGYWKFCVQDESVNVRPELPNVSLRSIYPNPASAITVVPLYAENATFATVSVHNAMGQTVQTLFEGELPAGEKNLFLHADQLPAGTYWVTVRTPHQALTQKLLVR